MRDMATEALLRHQIIEHGLKLSSSGLSPGTSGNLSVRWGEGFLITPSGVPYGALRAEDIVPVALDGRCSHRLAPSSEWQLHRDVYAARPDIRAVVHAHAPHATALAIHGRGLPAVHYMIAAAGGPSIRCAPYFTYGTAELGAATVAALQGRLACLLAHHGLVAAGPSLARAYWLAGEVEALAQQYLLARQLGEPPRLPDDEIARVVAKFKNYGPKDKPA
jgi:L-fuculose-phosphate aldolase